MRFLRLTDQAMCAEYNTVGVAREREIFLAALDRLNPEDREAYLKAACGDDPALRRDIDELLREHAASGRFLEDPAVKTVPRGEPSTAKIPSQHVARVREEPGARIGRYRLLQTIGEGGCGVVYMAEQEEPVRRRVALKIIKLGMDTRQVIARFEAERQALAMMSHPNIAQVLDAGATETGRPFFVMELVRGIKITEYCDQNHLPTDERLKLFMQVCQAIQHAHQKGIIHRDIKPSNLLVTLHDGTPVPKVIDFGVAKATGQQRLTDKTVFTAFEQFIGTPAYMSPEQAEMSSLDIDTRSDIYSLGVLLYELLTGKTPFDGETLARSGLDECRRTIRQDEPDRPSVRLATMPGADLTTAANRRRTEVPKLVHMLKGDLDWIVMKCLEKDRTRRYATASELATDIRRFLDGETVLARPPSTLYQFKKVARRYRGLALATGIVGLTLLAAAAISLSLAIRAMSAEKEARDSRDRQGVLRQRAEAQREIAKTERAQAQVNEYVADINLAHQSLREGNYGRAAQLLEKHRPSPGEPDLRGFEWRYLWQVSRGDEHVLFPDQEGPVHAIAFSPTGDLVAVGGSEQCQVYDFISKQPKFTLNGGAASLTFSPNGHWLFAASTGPQGASLTTWNVETGGPTHNVRDAGPWSALSPDGQLFAANVRGGSVQVWDVSKGDWQERTQIRSAGGPLAFSPDGHRLAAVNEGNLAVFSVETGILEAKLENATNLFPRFGPFMRSAQGLVFSPDGRYVVAPLNVRSDHGIFILGIWDAVTGEESGFMPDDPEHIEHTGVISTLAFSPDGSTLATASLDHTIRLWDFSRRRRTLTLQGHLNEVWSLAFSPDGRSLVSGARDGGLKAWRPGQPRQNDLLPGGWQPILFSPDSQRLAALSPQGVFALVNAVTREPETELQLSLLGERGPRWRWLSSVSVNADLTRLAEGMQDGTVRLWNLHSREYDVLRVADHPVSLVVMSRQGRFLATGGFMQPTRLWDLRSGTNYVLGTEIRNVLFSPDGAVLATFSRENVELWDPLSCASIRKLEIGNPGGFAAGFSPDSRRLAVGASPGETVNSIHIFEVATGRLVGTCVGHKQPVFSVAFSPDGRTLASGSDDSTLRFWNLQTQQELMAVRRLGGGLMGLTFSPDGQMLAGFSRQSAQQPEARLVRAPFVKP